MGPGGWSWATDENQTDDLIRRLQKKVDREYPQGDSGGKGIDQGPPVEAPLEVRLYGPSTDVLKSLGEQFRRRVAAPPGPTPKVSMAPPPPKVVFDPQTPLNARFEKSRCRAGIEAPSAEWAASSQGHRALAGRPILKRQEWDSTDDLANIGIPLKRVPTRLGPVPLSALGGVALVPDESPIAKKNGDRLNNIQGYLKRGVLPEEALKMWPPTSKPTRSPPPWLFLEFGGDSQERGSSLRFKGPLVPSSRDARHYSADI
ncbi:MAG: hypothetical protein CM15mP103_09680 [Gammaproteobacteria bacterium]|nr:MAG: hypothetical protein CM15mP103_09680 [Gammaproteobacteria bacterium]